MRTHSPTSVACLIYGKLGCLHVSGTKESVSKQDYAIIICEACKMPYVYMVCDSTRFSECFGIVQIFVFVENMLSLQILRAYRTDIQTQQHIIPRHCQPSIFARAFPLCVFLSFSLFLSGFPFTVSHLGIFVCANTYIFPIKCLIHFDSCSTKSK